MPHLRQGQLLHREEVKTLELLIQDRCNKIAMMIKPTNIDRTFKYKKKVKCLVLGYKIKEQPKRRVGGK